MYMPHSPCHGGRRTSERQSKASTVERATTPAAVWDDKTNEATKQRLPSVESDGVPERGKHHHFGGGLTMQTVRGTVTLCHASCRRGERAGG